jgi:hypothetical protein
VQGGLLLDVVVGQGAAVLQLLPGEDEPLLVRRDPLLVLDLSLHTLDGVGGLRLEGDFWTSVFFERRWRNEIFLFRFVNTGKVFVKSEYFGFLI